MSSLPGSGGPAEKQQVPEPPPPDDQAGRESDQGETEDEEIKMNCIGGQCGMHDSDFSSDGGVDADSDEGEERDTSRYEKNCWVFESKTCRSDMDIRLHSFHLLSFWLSSRLPTSGKMASSISLVGA